jgi:hypothetical protein
MNAKGATMIRRRRWQHQNLGQLRIFVNFHPFPHPSACPGNEQDKATRPVFEMQVVNQMCCRKKVGAAFAVPAAAEPC